MRKLIFSINTTIDGCVDHTLGTPDDEMMAYFTRLMHEADTLVYGRKTYELMVPYWPDVAKTRQGNPPDVAFAEAWLRAPWGNFCGPRFSLICRAMALCGKEASLLT